MSPSGATIPNHTMPAERKVKSGKIGHETRDKRSPSTLRPRILTAMSTFRWLTRVHVPPGILTRDTDPEPLQHLKASNNQQELQDESQEELQVAKELRTLAAKIWQAGRARQQCSCRVGKAICLVHKNSQDDVYPS